MKISKIIGLMGGLLAMGGMAQARELPTPFGGSETAVAFAVDQGCLTYLREGTAVDANVERYARPITEDGKRVQKIYGGHVTISEDGRGGCYIKVRRGDGAALRDTVLGTLRDKGFKLEGFADYEPYVKARDWAYLQESYCWRHADQVFIVLISSSAIKRDVTLQATIFRDREGDAARKGLCLG